MHAAFVHDRLSDARSHVIDGKFLRLSRGLVYVSFTPQNRITFEVEYKFHENARLVSFFEIQSYCNVI